MPVTLTPLKITNHDTKVTYCEHVYGDAQLARRLDFHSRWNRTVEVGEHACPMAANPTNH